MKRREQQSAFRTAVALIVAVGLLLLLVPHTAAPHGFVLASFLSLPILFLGMIDVPRVLGMVSEINPPSPTAFLDRSSLFQRPPPIEHA